MIKKYQKYQKKITEIRDRVLGFGGTVSAPNAYKFLSMQDLRGQPNLCWTLISAKGSPGIKTLGNLWRFLKHTHTDIKSIVFIV